MVEAGVRSGSGTPAIIDRLPSDTEDAPAAAAARRTMMLTWMAPALVWQRYNGCILLLLLFSAYKKVAGPRVGWGWANGRDVWLVESRGLFSLEHTVWRARLPEARSLPLSDYEIFILMVF